MVSVSCMVFIFVVLLTNDYSDLLYCYQVLLICVNICEVFMLLLLWH